MALGHVSGSFQWLAADGVSTTYNSGALGFTAKAVKCWWVGLQSTVDAFSAAVNSRRGEGYAVSSTARRCVGSYSQDAAAAAICGVIARDDSVVALCDGAGASAGRLDVNLLGTSFELIVDEVAAANITVFWEAWGGDDITVAAVGDIAEPAAIGTQDYTVTGFAATDSDDQVVMFAGCQSTAALNTGQATDSGLCCGFASGGAAAENVVVCGNSDDGSLTMDTDEYPQSGECLAMIVIAGGNPSARAQLTQFNAGGFRLNWIARGTTNRRYIFLALKGGQWKAGEYTIDATTLKATATVSGLPFRPEGICFISGQTAEPVAGTANGSDVVARGSAKSTTARRAASMRDQTGAADADITHFIEYDAVIVGPGSTAAGVLIDLDAILSDGFRTIIDLQDAGASTVWWNGYLAFASAPATFDAAWMAAMNRPHPDLVFASPKIVASGMTPPDLVNQ